VQHLEHQQADQSKPLSRMALRSTMLGVRFVLGSSAAVNGLVLLPSANHLSISDRSYVCPSAVMTGSFINSIVNGHWKKSKTKRATAPAAAGAAAACDMPPAAAAAAAAASGAAAGPRAYMHHILMQYIRTHTHLQSIYASHIDAIYTRTHTPSETVDLHMCYIMHIPGDAWKRGRSIWVALARSHSLESTCALLAATSAFRGSRPKDGSRDKSAKSAHIPSSS
jgi:hypothetical protein